MKKRKFARALAPSKKNLKAIMEDRQKDEMIRKGLLDGFYYAKTFFGDTEQEINEKVEADPENSYMGMFKYFTSYYQGDILTRVLRQMAYGSLSKMDKDFTLKDKEIVDEFRKSNPKADEKSVSIHVYCVLRSLHYFRTIKVMEDLKNFKDDDNERITEEMKELVEKHFEITDRPVEEKEKETSEENNEKAE